MPFTNLCIIRDLDKKSPAVPLRKDTNLSCRRRPVNDYPELNSLMRRLANPGWDGFMKDIHTGLILEDGRIRPLGGTLTETDAGSVTPFLRSRFR